MQSAKLKAQNNKLKTLNLKLKTLNSEPKTPNSKLIYKIVSKFKILLNTRFRRLNGVTDVYHFFNFNQALLCDLSGAVFIFISFDMNL